MTRTKLEAMAGQWSNANVTDANANPFHSAYDAFLAGAAAMNEMAAESCTKYAHSGGVGMMRRQVAYACERRIRALMGEGE